MTARMQVWTVMFRTTVKAPPRPMTTVFSAALPERLSLWRAAAAAVGAVAWIPDK